MQIESSLSKISNDDLDLDKIDKKHNLQRIKNDYAWIFNLSDVDLANKTNWKKLVYVYWFDVNLRNIIFAWLSKFERELKSLFITFYKQFIGSNQIEYLITSLKKEASLNSQNLIRTILNGSKQETTIDIAIFDLTFGGFCILLNKFEYNNIQFLNLIADHLDISLFNFKKILKLLLKIRNQIAHNHSIIKSFEEKNLKYLLKKDFFEFEISYEQRKEFCQKPILLIYCLKKLNEKLDDSAKATKFIKAINWGVKDLKKWINNKEDFLSVCLVCFGTFSKIVD